MQPDISKICPPALSRLIPNHYNTVSLSMGIILRVYSSKRILYHLNAAVNRSVTGRAWSVPAGRPALRGSHRKGEGYVPFMG